MTNGTKCSILLNVKANSFTEYNGGESVKNQAYRMTLLFDFYGEMLTDRQKLTRALDAGVPVFVSECGLCDASGSGGVDQASAQAWFDLMNSRGVSFAAWSLCNKNETASLIRSDCS